MMLSWTSRWSSKASRSSCSNRRVAASVRSRAYSSSPHFRRRSSSICCRGFSLRHRWRLMTSSTETVASAERSKASTAATEPCSTQVHSGRGAKRPLPPFSTGRSSSSTRKRRESSDKQPTSSKISVTMRGAGPEPQQLEQSGASILLSAVALASTSKAVMLRWRSATSSGVAPSSTSISKSAFASRSAWMLRVTDSGLER
mmetsp:Transcript_122123/g.290348  ORF Transcript_122123/g.290348 Transcript_122123/m.290348 type:complete len:201 (-) Transcript_122123:1245-1847(-)